MYVRQNPVNPAAIPCDAPPGMSRKGLPLVLRLVAAIAIAMLAGKAEPAAGICDRVAQQVARETDMPPDVLRAITRVETGRRIGGRLTPWPWTLNIAGQGHWFGSRAEALDFAMRHFRRGIRNIDLGCFQISYRWHHQNFTSMDQMLDPLGNARYAARFLRQLYRETGAWDRAVAAYHSRTPEHARRYLARFERVRAGLAAPRRIAGNPAAGYRKRVNSFPLLRGGAGTRNRPSLVPLADTGRRALIPALARTGEGR